MAASDLPIDDNMLRELCETGREREGELNRANGANTLSKMSDDKGLVTSITRHSKFVNDVNRDLKEEKGYVIIRVEDPTINLNDSNLPQFQAWARDNLDGQDRECFMIKERTSENRYKNVVIDEIKVLIPNSSEINKDDGLRWSSCMAAIWAIKFKLADDMPNLAAASGIKSVIYTEIGDPLWLLALNEVAYLKNWNGSADRIELTPDDGERYYMMLGTPHAAGVIDLLKDFLLFFKQEGPPADVKKMLKICVYPKRKHMEIEIQRLKDGESNAKERDLDGTTDNIRSLGCSDES